MSRQLFFFCLTVASIFAAGGSHESFLTNYRGVPYHDIQYQGDPQKIPGRVMCAYYDLGGEGVAYHDTDPQNHGSGELNPADGSYLNEFRMHEGVDTSYTKFNRKPDPIDDSPFDTIVPPADMPYVGWTEAGEWFNITVDVAREGTYAADFLYTSNRGGTISVDVNGKDATGPLKIQTTFDSTDPVAWRQWHHWNVASQLFNIPLGKGKNVLTVHILTGGNMNLAYFDFKRNHDGPGPIARKVDALEFTTNPKAASVHLCGRNEAERMAAFCGCCGAEITEKPAACPICGTPRHGMMPADSQVIADLEPSPFQSLSNAPAPSQELLPSQSNAFCDSRTPASPRDDSTS